METKNDEYLSIKIDVGLLMKKLEEWKLKQSKQLTSSVVDDGIFFSASVNDRKENDSQPSYKSKNIAVWHNVKSD